MRMGLPRGLRAVWDGRVLEGDGEFGSPSDVWSPGRREGEDVLLRGQGCGGEGDNPGAVLSNYNI